MDDTTSERLRSFRKEVDLSLVFGPLADVGLPVVDDHGQRMVVVALGDERLGVLLRRIAQTGGNANVFVKGADDEVVRLSVINDPCALDSNSADDMTGDARPSLQATVAVFVDYLRTQRSGVRIPLDSHDVPMPRATVVDDVQFA